MGDQQPQDLKLCLGERDHLLPVPHLMIGEVDRQHPALHPVAPFAALPLLAADQRMDDRHEPFDGKRLVDVGISAQLIPADLLPLSVCTGQKYDRRPVRFPNVPAQIKSVAVGETHIDQIKIEYIAAHFLQCFPASIRTCQLDGMAAQAQLQTGRQGTVIFHI